MRHLSFIGLLLLALVSAAQPNKNIKIKTLTAPTNGYTVGVKLTVITYGQTATQATERGYALWIKKNQEENPA